MAEGVGDRFVIADIQAEADGPTGSCTIEEGLSPELC